MGGGAGRGKRAGTRGLCRERNRIGDALLLFVVMIVICLPFEGKELFPIS